MGRLALALAPLVAALAAPSAVAQTPPARPDWAANVAAAKRYAAARAGRESFALVDETGRLRGRLVSRVYPSASVLKAMLLVAYLNERSVRGRALRADERNRLEPMIRWSANEPATEFVRLLGRRPLDRLALHGGMDHFRLVVSPWGYSEITARGQARYFRRIFRLTASRHRPYARQLLNTVVPAQRWGIPPAKPPGWRIYLKGGWGIGTGWITNQVALLERGRRRVSLAVLTRDNPSHTYGTDTIEGIASRLLRGLR